MSNGGAAPEFDVPDHVLSVIPTDPYEQLDLARKITSMAISSRVSGLETETGKLRESVAEKDRAIGELRGEVSRLEVLVQQAENRVRAVVEDNAKLCRDKEMLELTAKTLSRDLVKLESFKKHLMQSLSEDNLSHPSEKVVGNYSQSALKASSLKDEGMVSHNTEMGGTRLQASSMVEQKSALSPYINPRLTPTTTPKATSSATSPRVYSAAESAGATSPTKTRIDGKIVLSPWYSSSQRSSAASSPPRDRALPGRAPRIDGKEFFRQARNRLSYEQFGAFLANIKEFNAHKQSREETLKKTDEIFGSDNRDLYSSFHGMLNRHLS